MKHVWRRWNVNIPSDKIRTVESTRCWPSFDPGIRILNATMKISPIYGSSCSRTALANEPTYRIQDIQFYTAWNVTLIESNDPQTWTNRLPRVYPGSSIRRGREQGFSICIKFSPWRTVKTFHTYFSRWIYLVYFLEDSRPLLPKIIPLDVIRVESS